MATSTGIYLKHPTLSFGDALTRTVDDALRPMLPFGAHPGDPQAQFDIRMDSPASFDFPGTKAVIHITGKPTEQRVSIARSMGKMLASAGFGIVIEDEILGEIDFEY